MLLATNNHGRYSKSDASTLAFLARGRLRLVRRAIMLELNERAPVAQLDRASGYEPEGREFESPRARHFSQ
jgi:hypothetical protein